MPIKGVVDAVVLRKMLGDFLGKGSARKVYKYKGNSRLVIKVGKTTKKSSNQTEWKIWNKIKDTAIRDVFGECFAMSKSGKYLLMEHLAELSEEDKSRIPKIPCWISDRKRDLFGRAHDGKIKIKDYGQIKISLCTLCTNTIFA